LVWNERVVARFKADSVASKALAIMLLVLGAAAARAAEDKPSKPVVSQWSVVFYGFAELDVMHDSVEGLNEVIGNTVLPRAGTYAATHDQLMFSVRNSRLGVKVGAPDLGSLHASAVAEMDFFGNQPPGSEASFFNNPGFRIRHFYFTVESPVVDVTVGQTWDLFGWQSYFSPATVNLQGIPGQAFGRGAQVRVSKTFEFSPDVNLEVAAAALRPPQRAGGLPDGQAGFKLNFPFRKGYHYLGEASRALDPMAISVTGAVRRFAVPAFEPDATTDVTTAGWGVSVNVLVPIIAASNTPHGHALTFVGAYVRGAGIADLFTELGGPPFPPFPGTSTPYTAPIDPGLVGFDSSGQLQAVSYQSFLAGLQYWLPRSTGLEFSANYTNSRSFNAASLANGDENVVVRQQFASGAMFWHPVEPIRFGLEYAWLQQQFTAGPHSVDRRVQLSTWYVF
jgi:hypothetical protein